MILITGITGSFGTAASKQLGADCCGISRSEARMVEWRRKVPGVPYLSADVTDPAALRRAFVHFKPTEVIHAAAHKHISSAADAPGLARVNVQGTINVADLCREFGARLLLLSTDKAVEATTIYGASKKTAEGIVLATGGSVLRYGNVWGSSGSAVPLWLEQDARKEPLTVRTKGGASCSRWFLRLEHAVECALLVLDAAAPPGVYVPRHLKAARMGDIARTISPDVRLADGLPFGEKLDEVLTDAAEAHLFRAWGAHLYCTNSWDAPPLPRRLCSADPEGGWFSPDELHAMVKETRDAS